MPETAVDKHGEPPPREDDVGAHAGTGKVDAVVNPVAVTCGVQKRPQREFGTCVTTTIGLHIFAARGDRWPRIVPSLFHTGTVSLHAAVAEACRDTD